MADIYDKRSRARLKFIGQKVRRIFSKGRFRTCVNVECYGPPSGWNCVYELVLEGGSNITVERFSDIEVKAET